MAIHVFNFKEADTSIVVMKLAMCLELSMCINVGIAA